MKGERMCGKPENLRVAAYCRVSTEKEDQQHSLEAQQDFFQQYILERTGWTMVGIYADQGLSGTGTNRPQFARLIALARGGGVDLILTKEVSRFARNTVDTLALTRQLRACGVGVQFLSDGIDTRDEDGEFRLTMMASVAQEESRKISQRTKWGQIQALKRGVVFGNSSIFGYRLEGGKLFPEAEQAVVVEQIFHQFLDQKKGTWVIARELTQAGISPPLGGDHPWSSTAVLRILRNEKYCGDLLQHKYRTLDYLTHKKIQNDGAEPQFYLRDHHRAIVSRDCFQAVQRELDRRKALAGEHRRFSARYWYSGKVYCGICGSICTVKRNKGRAGEKTWRFCCKGRDQGGEERCSMRSVSGPFVESCAQYVTAQLPLHWEAVVEQVMAEVWPQKETSIQTESAHLKREMSRQNARRTRAREVYLDGELSRLDWKEQTAACDAALASLRARENALHGQRGETSQEYRSWLQREVVGGACVLEEVIEKIFLQEAGLTILIWDLPVQFQVEGTKKSRQEQMVMTKCTCLNRVNPAARKEEEEGGVCAQCSREGVIP